MVSCLSQMLGKILLGLFVAQGVGNQNTGAVRGQIIIPSVHASERIPVQLQKADGPLVGQVYSDIYGNFDFHSLTPGDYVVLVSVDGYEDIRQEVGVGRGSFGAATVNITLREKERFIVVHPDGVASDQVVDLDELRKHYPRKAVQDYEKARDEIRKDNVPKALDLLVGVIQVAPDFYNAHNTLGTLYQKTGRFSEAENEYRRASELNPKSADPLVNLGSVLIDEAVGQTDRGTAGKILDEAMDTLEASLKMKRTVEGFYFLGTAYYRSAFYEEAEDNLMRALALNSGLGATRLMLANVYMKQRRWQKALEHLDAYLAEHPKAADRRQIEETRLRVAERIKK